MTLFIPFVEMSSAGGTGAGLGSRGPDEGGEFVDFFRVAEFAVELVHLQGTGRDLAELIGVGAVGALHRAVEFGRTGRKNGRTNRWTPRCWQACSNSAANSGPLSICTARMGNSIRCCFPTPYDPREDRGPSDFDIRHPNASAIKMLAEYSQVLRICRPQSERPAGSARSES